MEKAGVPTVTIVTSDFVTLAESTVASQGLVDMCFAVVPHPVGMLPEADVWAKVDAAYDEIIRLATAWQPAEVEELAEVQSYPARRFNFTGTYYDLNELFKRRNWSLSLPIVPPTVDKVEEMLTGTDRDPAEVVWIVPPRQGILTVELVAALGVMAGAKPEHMPILLAAVEAFSSEMSNWRGSTTTTAPSQPVIIISGPIIDELGLNSSTGVIGPENPITNSVGYFLNLVGDIVGGSVRPHIDMSTMGSPTDFVVPVFVENNAENPWPTSFAEDRGFAPTDSVLTAVTFYPANANVDHSSVTGSALLTTMAAGIAGSASGAVGCFAEYIPGGNNVGMGPIVMLTLAPEHAATIASEFPNKDDARAYLAENTAVPFKYYVPGICVPPEDFGEVTPDTLVPRFKNGNSIFFLVSGGPGKHSQIWPIFGTQTKDFTSVLIEGY